MSYRWTWTALLLLAGLAPPAPAQESGAPSPEPVRPTSPEEVRAELGAVCRSLESGDHPYFGERVVGQLESRLLEPVSDPQVAVGLRGRLASALLRLGRPAEAVRRLEEAREIAAERALPESLRLQVDRALARAHFQLAEDVNCVADHGAGMCLLPVTPRGVHREPAPARRAGDLYAGYLERRPDPETRWLLVLARMISGDYPERVPEAVRLPPGALEPETDYPPFEDLAPGLGVADLDLSGGGIMDDFDGDGLLDLVASTHDPCDHMKAYRNDGRGGFEETTRTWGLDVQLGGLNLAHADYDGDGDLDLLVLRGGWMRESGRVRNSLLRNEIREGGGFVDVTEAAGLAAPAYPTQTGAWADYDGDGDLDLYVGNEAELENLFPSQLYRNRGDGTFEEVAAAAGVENLRYAKGVAWGDYDDDGDPDLHVSNLGPNRLYRNDGGGTFTDVAPELGVTGGTRRTFPTWFFDYDNDGDLDLFVGPYDATRSEVAASYLGLPTEGGRPLLFRNDGGRFTEVAVASGLDRPVLPMGADFGDGDGDGYPDLYLGTGTPSFDALMPNVLYANRPAEDGAGRRFADATAAAGLGHLQKGHSVAFGDVDNDGDLDLFEQMGGAYPGDAFYNALYENRGEVGSWLRLRLVGKRANRSAFGARVEVVVAEPVERVEAAGEGEPRGEGGAEGAEEQAPRRLRSIHHHVAGSSFGGSSLDAELGLGDAEAIERVTIRWPGSGTVQELEGLELDRAYRVVEGEAPEPLELPRIVLRGGGAEENRHREPSRDGESRDD